MENKKLSLEDKVKPYLLLAKTIEAQMKSLQKNNSNYDVSERNEKINTILRQMLLKVNLKDLGADHNNFLKSFDFAFLDFETEETETEKLPLSNLTEIIKIKNEINKTNQ